MNYCCMSKMEWLGVTECQKSYPSQNFFSQMNFFFLLAVLTEGHRSTMPSAVVLWMVQMFVLFALVCHTYRRLSCTKQVDESFHTHTATTLSSQGVYFRFCNYAIKNKPVVRLIAQTAAIRSCSHNSNVCNFCFSVCIVYFVGPSGVQNNFPFAGPLHSNAVAKYILMPQPSTVSSRPVMFSKAFSLSGLQTVTKTVAFATKNINLRVKFLLRSPLATIYIYMLWHKYLHVRTFFLIVLRSHLLLCSRIKLKIKRRYASKF